ncbi:tail completion protein gp17 [Sphingomonas silueang]|uniref:tail completion protein gp17 n=1 Tax=Sphingomonas silueang TaxID=3156617 RepID=UPI0032B5803D
MIAGEALQAMLVAELAAALDGVAVFDAPPVRGARPHALIDMPVLTDWGTKDAAGREGRVVVQLFDSGERPVRLRGLAAAAEAAVLAAPGAVAGWRIVSLVFLRSRLLREGDGRWMAGIEFRVRMLAVG